MDTYYDAIVLGTGLKESILAWLLSLEGKKVLRLDRNSFYGGECASVSITKLYEMFKPGQTLPEEKILNIDWNIDDDDNWIQLIIYLI